MKTLGVKGLAVALGALLSLGVAAAEEPKLTPQAKSNGANTKSPEIKANTADEAGFDFTNIEPKQEAETSSVDLSPASWPEPVLAAYQSNNAGTPLGSGSNTIVETTGMNGLVASTSGAMAVHAGVEALKQGGTAADAGIAVALAHVALHVGGATSYAGQFGGMYFDASTGTVHQIDAGYVTVLGEDDPMSIPPYGTPSGRAVLVPGFMRGIEALHERFGRLPFAELFEPAIYIAEEGFEVGPNWAGMMQQREHVLSRRPEGRKLFLDGDGELPGAGDRIRQPEVAGFLRRIASEGADYMYEGEWAHKFVDVVQQEGGKMSLEDLARYEASWFGVAPIDFRGYDVYANGVIGEQLRMVELADLRRMGHYSQSPDALYWLIKISRVSNVLGPWISGSGISREEAEALVAGLDLSPGSRFAPATTKLLWATMQTPLWQKVEARTEAEQLKEAEAIAKLIKDFSVRKPKKDEDGSRPDHTAGITVIDAEGNMLSLVHSVTSAVWGELGIFVEGVSVVDPGAFAQNQIAKAGPGKSLFYGEDGAGACPVLVLKDKKPFLGCGNVGASFDVVATQGLVNMLEYGMSTAEVARQPMFRKNWPPGQPVRQPAGEGEFDVELIDQVREMGIDIVSVDDPAQATEGGIWVVGSRDPETGLLSGAVTAGTHSRISMSDSGLVEAH